MSKKKRSRGLQNVPPKVATWIACAIVLAVSKKEKLGLYFNNTNSESMKHARIKIGMLLELHFKNMNINFQTLKHDSAMLQNYWKFVLLNLKLDDNKFKDAQKFAAFAQITMSWFKSHMQIPWSHP
jgi:hypothetical protein